MTFLRHAENDENDIFKKCLKSVPDCSESTLRVFLARFSFTMKYSMSPAELWILLAERSAKCTRRGVGVLGAGLQVAISALRCALCIGGSAAFGPGPVFDFCAVGC